MATKLKNLSVTSVDLVDQGANPDAHIRLFKRRGETDQNADPDEGLFKKFLGWMAKGFEDATGAAPGTPDPQEETEGVTKEAQTFTENLSREIMRQITSEMFDCCYALSDSLSSIICDNTLTAEQKESLMRQSVDEFNETIGGALAPWAKGEKMQTDIQPEAGIQKSTEEQEALQSLIEKRGLTEPEQEQEEETAKANIPTKEVVNTMNIDKSKMTPEELATLADFEKRYGMDGTGDEGAGAGTETPAAEIPEVAKGADAQAAEKPAAEAGATTEMHPEVAKALAEFHELAKKRDAEVEELKKSLEIEKLTSVAKKYEVLGKKADELAGKLYEMKKAGGTVYDDYVALLDESVETVNKSGIFGEIGSNNQGSAGTEATLGMKAAELAKSAEGGMNSTEAIIKAFEQNTELAAQYEREYMGR